MSGSSPHRNCSAPFHSELNLTLPRDCQNITDQAWSNISSHYGCSNRCDVKCSHVACRKCFSVNSVHSSNFGLEWCEKNLIYGDVCTPRKHFIVKGLSTQRKGVFTRSNDSSKTNGSSESCKHAHFTLRNSRQRWLNCNLNTFHLFQNYLARKLYRSPLICLMNTSHCKVYTRFQSLIWSCKPTILVQFCANIWRYILFDYFRCRAYYRVIKTFCL